MFISISGLLLNKIICFLLCFFGSLPKKSEWGGSQEENKDCFAPLAMPIGVKRVSFSVNHSARGVGCSSETGICSLTGGAPCRAVSPF